MSLIGERYQVGPLLGSGGMGTVFLADDTQTGRKVALKRFNSEVLQHEKTLLERFRREAEILRELNHPGIVGVIDTFEDGDHHYIVMDYISGGSLRQLLDHEKKLPMERALRMALDLADALTRAHRLNIVHRDLKPANVMIAADGTPRLTDFGVALMGSRERVTDTGDIVGTLDYLSPEALNSEKADGRADIWSFGVMLYEMLTGERPFKGGSPGQTIRAIMSEPTPRLETKLPDCPVALVDLIDRMLEKDRALRLPGIRLAGAEIEALLSGAAMASMPVMVDMNAAAVPPVTGRFDTPTPEATRIAGNIAAQTTPFIGREAELAELKTLLANPDYRLVTLLAPGGTGKTSLALETARQIIADSTGEAYRHGVFAVLLAPLSLVEQIVPAMAGAMGLQFGPGSTPKEQLLEFLREKHLLLVLDNFEHLMAGAGLVTEILQAAPNVRLLVTSRERLNLSSETIMPLSGMDFPVWQSPDDALQYSAVKLFIQSARRVRPDFELKADSLRYVAQICRLTAGMPLGILLAAAWVELLSPAEIAAEIGKSIDFLSSDMRDLPERHRSMRATFEYSWKLLDDETRQAFQKLSIFRGGFTREAAQVVTGISLRGLITLVNKSLLQRNIETGRFDMHELLRQYAEERQKQSGEFAAAQQAHAAYFAEFLGVRWDDLKGRRQIEALHEIDPEFENIRSAWPHHPWHTGSEMLMNMVKSLWYFSDIRKRAHVTSILLSKALTSLEFAVTSSATSELYSLIKACYAWLQVNEGKALEGKHRALEAVAALEIAHHSDSLIIGLMALSLCTVYTGENDLMLQSAERCVLIARQTKNAFGLIYGAIFCIGEPASLFDLDTITSIVLSASDTYQDGLALGLFYLTKGLVLLESKKYEAARSHFDQALLHFDHIGDFGGRSRGLQGLARLSTDLGDFTVAVGYYRQALRLFPAGSLLTDLLEAIGFITRDLAVMNRYELAVELNNLVLHHARTSPVVLQECVERLATLKTQLSPEVYAAAVERGKKLTLDEAVTRLVENEDWENL